MLGWKYFRLIGLIFIIYVAIVSSEDSQSNGKGTTSTLTALPTCGDTGKALCNAVTNNGNRKAKRGGQEETTVTFEKDNICIKDSKIYKATNSDCSQIKPSSTTVYIFTCSENKCKQSDSDSSLTGDILIYQVTNTGTATSKISDSSEYIYFHSRSKKLIICKSTGCEIQTNEGFYLNTSSSNVNTDTLLFKVEGEKASTVTSGVADGNHYLDESSKSKEEGGGGEGVSEASYTKIISCTTKSNKVSCSSSTPSGDAIFINSAVTSKLPNALIQCTSSEAKTRSENTTECKAITGVNGNFYFNGEYSGTSSSIISCISSKCQISSPSTEGTFYYVDHGKAEGGDDSKTYPVILECTKTSSKTECKAKEDAEGVYVYSEKTKTLINCPESSGASTRRRGEPTAETSEGCELVELTITNSDVKYYINAGADKTTKPLIKCNKSSCTALDPGTGSFYYMDEGEAVDGAYPNIIECTKTTGTSAKPTCTSLDDAEGIYVNAGDAKKLIKCPEKDAASTRRRRETNDAESDTGEGCKLLEFKSNTYYINAGEDKETKPLIECDNDDCSAKDPGTGSFYYMDEGEAVDGAYPNIIECTKQTGSNAKPSCESKDDAEGIYVNAGNAKKLIKCPEKKEASTRRRRDPDTDPETGEGCELLELVTNSYYINAGGDSTTNPLIKCESSGCTAKTPDVGIFYYLDQGKKGKDDNYLDVIKCTRESSTSQSPSCEAKEDIDGVVLNKGTTAKKDRLISCSGASEEGAKTSGGCSAKSGDIGYYLNGDTENVFLIKCTSSGECGEESNPSTVSAYVDANTKDKNDKYKMIVCNKSGNEIGCEYNDSPEGVYINAGVTAFNKDPLIICSEAEGDDENPGARRRDENGESANICEVKAGVANTYYLNKGADSETKPLINCGSNSCTTIDPGAGIFYYLDEETKAEDIYPNIIKCSKEGTSGASECEIKDSMDGAFINAGTSTTANRLILCTGSESELEQRDTNSSVGCQSSAAVNGNYYLNGDTENVFLIKCADGTCVEEDNPSTVGVYIDANSKGDGENAKYKLIQCSDSGTSIECSNPEEITSGYYVDASSGKSVSTRRSTTGMIFSRLIACDENGCEIASGIKEGYYVNAIVDENDGSKEALIQCSGSGTSLSCALTDGVKNEVFINNADNFLIQCFDDDNNGKGCVSVAASEEGKSESNSSSILGTTTNPTYFINGDPAATFAKIIIKCNGEKCETMAGSDTSIYLNGNHLEGSKCDDENQLIVCTSTTCATQSSSLEEEGKEFYLNAGKYTEDDTAYPIIKCEYGESVTCEASEVTPKDEDPKDVYFINGNYGKDGKYLIKCSAADSCSLYPLTKINTDRTEHYIHGLPSEDNPLTDAVIECTFTSGGEDSTDSVTPCTLIEIEEGNIFYVNSPDKNLIQCVSEGGCSVVSTGDPLGTTTQPIYYINGNPETEEEQYKSRLIECKGAGTCTEFNGKENGVYINGNYSEEEGADQNRLIICYDKKCNGNPATVSEEEVGFYVNSAITAKSTDYKSLIIKCANTGACEPFDAKVNDVFINKNYNPESEGASDKTNQLIVCSEGYCLPTENTAQEGKDEYYVDAGTYDEEKSKYQNIIKCSNGGSSVTCEPGIDGELPENEIFFINKNYSVDKTNYVIKCDNEGCMVTSSSDTTKSVEHYVHGTPGEEKLTNTIIECSFGSGNSINKRAAVATCIVMETIDEYSIFINSSDKKLIQCSDNENGCEAITEGTMLGDSGVPVYYINSAVEEASDYSDLMIKCEGTCSLVKAKENGVYINGNLSSDNNENGEEGNPLIICSNNKCLPTPYEASTTNEYFVNAGAINTSKLVDTLIECTTEGTCGEKDLTELVVDPITEVFFINKNYDDEHDNINYLIKCDSSNGCFATGTSNPEDGSMEHYIHGAAEGLTNAIIEVTFSSGTTRRSDTIKATPSLMATPSLIETATKDTIYLNSSTKKLIQCTEEACSAYASIGTEKIHAYYINAATSSPSVPERREASEESYDDLLIECSHIDCQLKTPNPNDVYLNGNLKTETNGSSTDENQLIVCGGGECNSQKSESETPEYYINSGVYEVNSVKYPLIVCEAGSCDGKAVDLKGASSHFYINANYNSDESENKDTKNYIIQCSSSDHCEATYNQNVKNGDIIHYVHGAPDEEEKSKNGVVKCVVGGESSPSKREEDEETFLPAECTLIEKTISKESESNIYINAINSKQIIRCLSNGCVAVDNNSTTSNSVYYINEDTEAEGSSNTNLIKCTSIEGCELITSFTQEGENESEDDLQDENKVFLNGNYRIGMDTKYPLIKCGPPGSESGDARKREDTASEISCQLAESNAKPDVPEFYVNADRKKNLIEDYDGPLKTDIIKCVSNKSSDDNEDVTNQTRDTASTLDFTCSVSSQTTKADDIFLNANFEITMKQIIKCTSDKGCYEAPAYPEEETEVTRRDDDDDTTDSDSSSNSSNLIYYVNAGAVKEKKLEDTLIQCTSSEEACKIKDDAKAEQIYINANNNQLIQCYADSGCVAKLSNASNNNNEFFLNSSDLDNAQDQLTNDLIKCTLDTATNAKKCEPWDGKPNKVYINSYNTGELIYCLEGFGCGVKSSQAITNRPEYYVNGDDIDFTPKTETRDLRKRQEDTTTTQTESNEKDLHPLTGDLIECKMTGSSGIKCSVINGNLGDVYINSNYNKETDEEGHPLGDNENQLIKCSETGCTIQKVESEDLDKLPEYYINSGNKATRKFDEALIMCSVVDEACTLKEANPTEIYVNSNENQPDKPIIKCGKNNCSASMSGATKDSKEYYVNAGKITDSPLEYDIIECSIEESNVARRSANDDSSTVTCKCLSAEEVGVGSGIGVYLNSNYASDGNQLIQCSKDNGCNGIPSESTSKIMEYYVNAESNTLTNAIIFCSNKKCEKQSPATVPMYYVGKDGNNDVNGLIECVSTPEEEEQANDDEEEDDNDDNSDNTNTNTTTNEDDNSNTTPSVKRRKRGNVDKCTMKSAFNSQGYYLNSGYNKATNQTILCDSSEGCNTLKVDLGYYVNAGNSEKPIIKCEKEGSECSEEESPECPSSSEAIAGNYCFAENQLKFYSSSNSTAISASKSDDCYAFATIPVNGFPGIRSETGSLFKISRYFINRYYQSGVVMIDKNGKLVDTLTSDQSDISLYDCNDSTKICSERPGCTPNTYMYDAENKKAIFCNSGKMEYTQFSGYVVDGNRVTGGSKHPYIIYCESNGEKCSSFKPKVSTYYENSGYDASSNSLIQCSNNNCITVVAEAGYYVGHGESGSSGIIKCTSATTCTYSQVKSKVKYVNAGSDKTSYAIIECTKTNGCSVAKAKTGYYLTYSSTLLIQCTSPTSCVEFTPTVNYYDNADSSESSSTIINCVQNSNVVTCATEATNNGFYMSSLSNVLIRCKAGSKCKTITVKNGIFRGALKGLTSNNKRSEDDEQVVHENKMRDDGLEVVKESKARDTDVDDLEESGKMVSLRDNDDAYGIIRCVAGKCSALSPTELAAIPMCEFNNNKCYITLEYAMTKSATTSISAGNICTNSDRSVFYFATDTIVVKPNVISGVTATYIYTTTNSNCLEVNDSYDDMYFTVGSNIYLLDQGSVLQFYEIGYYFLNVAKNVLVKGNDIDAYNDENVKLYRCNGSSCSIVDKPESITYYADVNKRILKYNVNNDAYAFAYEKDITCIFANNKCTPNADMKSQEFCITYKGELVLATTDIKNRETGECYRASSISSTIYGYSQYLYNMNQFAAQMVDQTGYYIVSLSTNTTVVSKNYKTKNNSLVVYGCTLSSCKVYEPDEDTYYYDAQAKTILRYKDGAWNTPTTSGYAYISINPTNTYIYKFSKNVDDIRIQSIANYGYYYTVDNEMYHCDQDEDGSCTPIDETGYYFTNSGEIYYCVHDSEELEATECTKQACISGQYYFIDEAYYRCEVSSLLVPVVSRYCSYDDNVIINFPLALTEEFPDKIKQAVEGIQKNNNSTAIVSRRGKNYLEAVSGIFTNCTYNVEETKSTFDLVCVNNFVTVDKESDEVKICSIEQLGYVECIEDEDNPEKCNVSRASGLLKPSLFLFIASLLIVVLMNTY